MAMWLVGTVVVNAPYVVDPEMFRAATVSRVRQLNAQIQDRPSRCMTGEDLSPYMYPSGRGYPANLLDGELDRIRPARFGLQLARCRHFPYPLSDH